VVQVVSQSQVEFSPYFPLWQRETQSLFDITSPQVFVGQMAMQILDESTPKEGLGHEATQIFEVFSA